MDRAVDRGRGLGLDEPFFLILARPRTRIQISNFSKTQTRSHQVVFQKLSPSLDRFRGIYTPRPGRPPPKYSCK